MLTMQFTPVHAALGGVALGVAALGKWAINGRILGISGTVKGAVTALLSGQRPESWRLLFLAGLAGGACVAAGITPQAFDVLPATYTVARAALGGALVGVGAGLGSGCTSGHGICGLSRLSWRSLVYTCIFMGAGAAVATLADTAGALGIAAKSAPLVLPTTADFNGGALLVATAVLSMLGLAQLGGAVGDDKKAVNLVTEAASGALFAFGLVYSGMVKPSKVAAFLSVLHKAWDPSLMCVMGGALLVALPGFQLIKRQARAPVCAAGFSEPASVAVDLRLVVGGLLFGAGWGLSGICPGPALVALVATPTSAPIAAYCGAMALGLWASGLLERPLASRKVAAA